ncbi:MAG: asparagine synthase (glutamine-hydrolyzing) [Robiginitomaculum sp.]|nr:MAG: asparagine synthase (glutamine-hydrolyzing) [Robiginitomaculum sp.]
MCGILGIYGVYNSSYDSFVKALKIQRNRGPDHLGIKQLPDSILGHARLSIHDLSSSANQPMIKKDENYSLIFNGEIYNFRELREELIDKYTFQSDSDTEVLMNYLIEFGINKTLEKIDGMFSFSFHNRITGDVYIARDMYGEKPLYYSENDNKLIISSSLYSIVSINGFSGLNLQSVSDFIHYGYPKGSDTAAIGIKKLPPNSYIHYSLNSYDLTIHNYALKNRTESKINSDWVNSLDKYLKNSIKQCLDADVPIGCFLSGGVDSSLVASYIAEQNRSIVAYSIGFSNKEYDESNVAKNVAEHLGIDLKIKILDHTDLVKILEETEWVFDEPFADASYLATYALSQFAREDVTVCLSGDAGDEIFSGYNRHVLIPKIYLKTSYIPLFLRRIISSLLLNSRTSKNIFKFLYENVLLKGQKSVALDEKVDKFATIIAYENKSDLLFRVLAGKDYSSMLNFPIPFKHKLESVTMRSLSTLDLNSYLHEDVLMKVDRCSMASSLEARVPFLNKNIVQLAQNASDDAHLFDGKQKFAFKTLLSNKVPSDIIDRPKSGFSVPYKDIIDNQLKSKFEVYKNNLKSSFNVEYTLCIPLFDIVDSYYENKFNDYKLIWNIFFFLRWMNNINELR